MSRCDHCPIAGNCPGEGAARICDLNDPEHSAYLPWYAETLRGQEWPSVATQAMSFGKAVAGFIASGMATASDEEIARRRTICFECPHFDSAAEKCRKCGCNVALKAWMMSSACPIGRW